MKTTITPTADAVKPLHPQLEDDAPNPQPGGWRVSHVVSEPSSNYGDVIISDANGAAVCRVLAREPVWMPDSYSSLQKSIALEERDNISRLIAAAPELLQALEAMLQCNHELGEISRPVADEARAAIAKAKGGRP